MHDARALPRRRVYLGEGLTFEVRAGTARLEGEAIDVSSGGLGLALAVPLPTGTRVSVRYTGPGASGEPIAATIRHAGALRRGGRLLPRVGLVLRCAALDAHPCAAVATAGCPWFLTEHGRWRVSSVGAAGMTLAGAAPLLPGAELEFELHLPGVGVRAARGRVAGVATPYNDADTPHGAVASPAQAAVAVHWVAPDKELQRAIARFLLAEDAALSPAALRAAGLEVGSVARELTFDCATTAADLEDILSLRHLAHRAEGHLADVSRDDLRSSYDEHSRHLTCRLGGRIVGYVRVIFVDRTPAKSQYVSLGGHVVPPWLWRAGFVEAGAGAVHPDFQRAGLFVPLMQHALRVAVQSGHRYVLGACEDGLLAMYESMGYVKLEERVVEPKPGWSFRSHLILQDAERIRRESSTNRTVGAMAEAIAFATLAAEDVVERAA